MANSNRSDNENGPKRKIPPGKTVESREKKLIAMANSLAERKLDDGTASSQVILHYLKLGTTMAELEKEKLRQENLLLAARTEALNSAKRIEELYAEALKALGSYKGNTVEEDDEIT